MAMKVTSITLVISAGAGLVDALPHVPHAQFEWFGPHPKNFPTFPFHGFGDPSQTSSGGSFSSGAGSSLAFPTRFAYSTGGFLPTGTGWAVPSGTGACTAHASIPIGTGLSSVAGTSSIVPIESSASLPPLPSDQFSSLAGAASISSDSVSSVAEASDSAIPASSVPAASASRDPATSTSVVASSGCTFTDADAAAASKGSCSTIVVKDITVPAGETLDLTDLNDGTTVSFEGTTTFEYDEWEGPLMYISGTSITITGAPGHVIDGNGAKWWDGEGSNGGVAKPKFFYAHDLTDSTITGLNIKNTPVQGISVDGAKNLKIQDVTIDDSDGDSGGGHNTDCFDIGESTGVYLSGITCKNQDDCIAINSGTDIQFTGGTCSGGHGLSIGSVGGRDDNTVENIYIASSSISDSENGVRIKCNSGDTGSVSNVTYSGITLSGITDYGIVIEQDYENGSPTGTPTDGIPITDVTLEDITGSVTDDAQAYYILCAACSDWTVSGVDVTGGSQDEDCEGVPSGASSLC